MSEWARQGTWTDGAVERQVFFFDGDGIDLYGSFYRATPNRLGIGVVICSSWSREATVSLARHRFAARTAALGGCALLFQYPGTGDSFGTVDDVGLEELRTAAGAAVRELRRRAPGIRVVLAGHSLGAAVATLAAADEGVDALILLEPAPDAESYTLDLARQAKRGRLDRPQEDGLLYGQQLFRLDRGDAAPAEALAAFRGDALVVRSAENAAATPLPPQLTAALVPGTAQRHRELSPELVDAAVAWLGALEAPAAPALEPAPAGSAGSDGEVVEHAVLVPTRVGLLGAVVTEPAHPPLAQLVFLHGAGDPRAGINAHWARMVRAIARLGVQVLRVDWPSTAESHAAIAASIDDRLRPLPELVDWFRAHGDGCPLVLLGSCFGARATAELAPTLPDLTALGLIVPPLVPHALPFRLPFLRGLPAPRLRPSAARGIARVLGDVPVWVLAGDVDGDYPEVLARRFGSRAGQIEVAVVPGLKLHGFVSDAAQLAADERVLDWVSRVVAADAGSRERVGVEAD